MKRQGWCDKALDFYCEPCWSEYDSLQGTDGAEYAGKVWHDAILGENNDGDGKEALQFAKNLEMDVKPPVPVTDKTTILKDGEDEECDEEGDLVGELPQAFGGAKKAADVVSSLAPTEVQKAHIIVLVDTSGSMRTVDVVSEDGSVWLSRISAVTDSLSTFFERQKESACPHKFSLVSFNQQSCVHFQVKTAKQAVYHLNQVGFAASYGTHFVQGLAAAKDLLPAGKGTPHLLFFTDGRPADGTQMIQVAQQMMIDCADLRIHAIGFGDALDFDLLQQLTSIGRGTFAPSGRSIVALDHAFASVTTTITITQTVTSQSSKSSKSSRSSAFSFQGKQAPSCQDDSSRNSRQQNLALRNANFEPANQYFWGPNRSVSFTCCCKYFTFDGKCFQEHKAQPFAYQRNPVSLRLQPFTQGGMRLVYCFKDLLIPSFVDKFAVDEYGERDARLVAKLSRYVDDWHNSYEVVSSYAKSSAAARFYARVFGFTAVERIGCDARKMPRLVFVECRLYEAEKGSDAPTTFMVGERYLPGLFRKYNSNHGYVDLEAPDSGIAQAFSHFTFEASRGKHMVLDLQGVHLGKGQRFRRHLILTDPQVVSLERSFGPGDLGEKGMRAFFRTHKCGETCRQMKLDEHAWKRLRLAGQQDTGPAADGNAGLPATCASAGSISTLRTAGAMVEWQTQSKVDSMEDSSRQPSSQSKTSNAGTVDESKLVSGRDSTMAAAKMYHANTAVSYDSANPLQLADRVPVPKASPYPSVPSFGAKADGPLSAIMARTAGDSGKPDYDSLLSLRQPKKKRVLSTKPLKSPAMLQSLVEPSDADIPASQNQLVNSPQKSHASTSSLQSTGASSTDETATPSLCEPAQGGVKTCIIYGPASKKISLPTASRESVISAIQNQMSIPVDEQHLLQEASSQSNVDVYRVERKMDPRRLKFTQATVSPTFRDGRPIFDLLNDLNSQQIDPLRELEPLEVVLYNGCWWSLSNRRLWVLKHCTAALTHQPLHVRVRVRQPDVEFRNKYTTTNDGASVLVVQRARSPSPCAAKLAPA